MFRTQHLQQQRSILTEEHNMLADIIRELRKKRILHMMDPVMNAQLSYQIEEYEKRYNNLSCDIEALDTQIASQDITDKLYRALLRLNYHQQERLFQRMIDISSVGAFVIHGELEYGQSWLLNRLVNRVPYLTISKVISVNLVFRGRRWDFNAMQRELKRCVGLTHSHLLEEVVERVHEWWQTQPVILIFHNLDTLDSKYIREFFQGFWLPLVAKAIDSPCITPYYKLLMFLVDNSGNVDDWPLDCAGDLDSSWQPYVPVKPPRLAPILADELTNWIERDCIELPAKIRNAPIEDILKNSNEGIPQFVLEYICDLCDCPLYERVHLWIKY